MSKQKNSLQLGKIILNNYKTYEGTITVDLSRDLEKTITIIHGAMGRGKTTLLGAIYWCMYGESRSVDSVESDEGIITSNALNKLNTGDQNETFVEIYLYEDDELRYKIKRIIEFTKNQESVDLVSNSIVDGKISSGITLKETAEFNHLPKRSGSDDWLGYTEPGQVKKAIESIFPKSLSSYFLFDAELLDNFFDNDDEKHVKNGIEKISGLPIIDDAVKHLAKTSKEILKNIKSVNLEPIKNEVFHLENTIDGCKNKINDKNKDLKIITKKIDDKESYMRNHNEETIKANQAQFDELKENKESIGKKRDKHSKDINDKLLYFNIIIRLHTSVKNSLEKCNKWEKEGKIPIAVSGLALKNILSGTPPMCICGTCLEEGSKEREHMEDLLKNNKAESPVLQSISTGRGLWEEMNDDAEHTRIHDNLKELRADRHKLNMLYDEKHGKMKEIAKILAAHNVKEVREISQELKELREAEINIHSTINIQKEKEAKATRELEYKNNELTNTMAKDSKFTSQKNRMKLATILQKILENCKNELIDDLRSKVSEKTTEYFLKLVSKKEDFSKVHIRKNYQTSVLGKDEKSKALSAGQSCCLALSYIAAIRDISERNYFMMIDSPLHNISQEERVGIAKNLPHFLPGTQITLLVQDQEYTGSAKKDIVGDVIPSVQETMMKEGSVWKEYVLESNKESGNMAYNTVIKDTEKET